MTVLSTTSFTYDFSIVLGDVGAGTFAPYVTINGPPSILKPYMAMMEYRLGQLIGSETLLMGRPPGTIVNQLQFSTRVDGAPAVKPVSILSNKYAIAEVPTLQPSIRTGLPWAQDIEILVVGEGEKRSEVWGPFRLPKSHVVMTLSGEAPDGQESVPYDFTYGLVDFIPPAQWLASGTLPPGLVFEDGRIYGTPTTAGTYKFCVTVRAYDGGVRYKDDTIVINV